MKRLVVATIVMGFAFGAQANEGSGFRLGFQDVKSDLELKGGSVIDTKYNADLSGIELGYDFNNVAGVSATYSKGNGALGDYTDYRIAGEFGYDFNVITDYLRLKPYGSIGYENVDIASPVNTLTQTPIDVSMNGLSVGLGVRATVMKYGYVGLETTAMTSNDYGIDTSLVNSRITVGGKYAF
ncbi:outer membrane beta-barrel protein [Enterovibrio sp. 27052020O]|uniref:outer membrane beta-barrel protein n=1 Tax=Enterovibrio sp. 27052020O TaxID=3241166 RepID=UPI0038910A1A